MRRILIADDHAVVRAGLRQIIAGAGAGTVIVEVNSGLEVEPEMAGNRYDVVILDVSLPGKNGIEVLKDLHRKHPRVPVLMLSMHPEEQYALRALKAGAAGYLNKDAAPEELLTAVEKVLTGGKYITASVAERLALGVAGDLEGMPHEKLSDRELEVLHMLSSGIGVSQIGQELGLSPKTVSTYRTRILEKMGLETNADLIRYGIENGLA